MPTPEQARAAAEAHLAAANAADKDAIVANFASDGVWHDPVGRPPHVGAGEIGEFFAQSQTLADRIEMKPIEIITSGNEAAMILEIHATMGDTTMIMDCVETLEVNDDGKVTLMKAYWDMSRARTRGA